MKAVNVKVLSYDPRSNVRLVEALIVADSPPETLPITGEQVDGLTATDRFAPFSMIFVVGDTDHKLYIANESGVFIPQ